MKLKYFFCVVFVMIFLNACAHYEIAPESEQSFTKIIEVSEPSIETINAKTVEWVLKTFPSIMKKDIEVNSESIKFIGSKSVEMVGLYGMVTPYMVNYFVSIEIKSGKLKLSFSDYYIVTGGSGKETSKVPANYKGMVGPLNKSFEEYSIDLQKYINGNKDLDW